MKFIYTGRCAAGFVKFARGADEVVFPMGEAVEAPAWLEAKLAANSHFQMETVDHEYVEPETGAIAPSDPPKRRGRPPKNP